MKRSRRSLGLLLATMSVSLSIVRTTTLPACPMPSATQEQAVLRPNVTVAKTVWPFEQPLRKMTSPVMTRPVSSTAVILVLPRAAVVERDRWRSGWSGCTAFAHGCDHRGRPLVPSFAQRSNAIERFVVGELERLVTLATRASLASAAALCELAPPSDHQVLVSERPPVRE